MSPLKIGIAGLGTVGAGVVCLLQQNAALIEARSGRPLAIAAVSARDRTRDRGLKLKGIAWHDDPQSMIASCDVIVELIGGAEGPARALVEAALAAGRPVVTANKALLALHGARLAASPTPLAFEAAVAGGIPAIKTLREGLAANQVTRIAGILNGTCNYILTTMREEGRDFAAVLADAQALGYAEADPAFDIDGVDTAHKLAILAALAFGHPVDFASIPIEGIRHVSALDIAFATELGYRIKLLGLAEQGPTGIRLRVHPAMVPASSLLASVEGVFNAVLFQGNAAGPIFLQGRGAGAGPTASAVVADLIDLARGHHLPVWGQAALAPARALPLAQHEGAYFLRLMVVDQPGVLADITSALRDHGISLASMLQHGRKPGEAVPIVLVTHECTEAAIAAALAVIGRQPAVLEHPTLIRIEP
jgi:homoserine dehydrogenase